jgi:hypothetical protein
MARTPAQLRITPRNLMSRVAHRATMINVSQCALAGSEKLINRVRIANATIGDPIQRRLWVMINGTSTFSMFVNSATRARAGLFGVGQ